MSNQSFMNSNSIEETTEEIHFSAYHSQSSKFSPFLGVNFINILHSPFCVKAFCSALKFFWSKNIDEKAARKMMKKLTIEV